MRSVLSVVTTTARRGAETFAVDLAAELNQRELRVEVVALTTAATGDDPLPIPVLGGNRRGVRTIAALRRKAQDADVVIANGSTTLPVAALATAGTGTPFVYRNVGDPRFWGSTVGRRTRTGMAIRRATTVVALTSRTAASLHDLYGVSPERIVVIPKGVPAARAAPTSDERRRERRLELGLPDGPLALYLGALSAEKRPDLAVQAVSKASVPIGLVIVGDGPERTATEASASQLLPDRCWIVGQVDDPSPYLQAADVLILPSDTEGLPGAAMEAGITGIPVVATDVGGLRDIVLDGSTGFVVPAGSAAALATGLSEAITRRDNLGRAARLHCLSTFEIGAIADRWAQLLTALP